MSNSPLQQLHALGQSIWLDYIHTDLMSSGELQTLIERDALQGMTSNPAIFEQAIAKSDAYDERIRDLVKAKPDLDANGLFVELALIDIAAAADILKPVWANSRGDDGMVSLEVNPELAHDRDGTIAEALSLHARLDRPNVMIKVPGTKAGVEAFEELTSKGVSVNVTLLFSVERYREIAAAYIRGLSRRLAAGQDVSAIGSVASFFISRVDSAVDAELESMTGTATHPMKSTIAVANAKVAWGHYQNLFGGSAWAPLAEAGALPQRLLWASTGTKNPDLPLTHYIDTLIGADTVNTVPPATLDAYREAGEPAATLDQGVEEASRAVASLSSLGINLNAITDTLEAQGISSFQDAFTRLLAAIDSKRSALS